ncbi:MAG: hypothetical protein EOO42_04020 [Flavobacteriales bacterium]|nr:MAG: hypothetical protein EOO42_04020 [Flavobacteriales bacterium]
MFEQVCFAQVESGEVSSMFLFPQFSRRVLGVSIFALLPFTGAVYLAQAQTNAEERAIVDRALNAQHSDMRIGGRRGEGTLSSPDGNFVVLDLGDSESNGQKARSHAVYDFVSHKVYIVRFKPVTNQVDVTAEALR